MDSSGGGSASTGCHKSQEPHGREGQPAEAAASRLGAHDVLNDCTMTVDGTGFRILPKGIATKGNAFRSHK